jgi:DNA-binding NarL/FixJ family response regulator
MTTNKIRVLCVDDDPSLLNALKRTLRKEIDLTVAQSAIDGLRALEKDGPFAVVISDQNMPKIKGTTFLAKVAKHFPLTVRIMLTGNSDQFTAISAVNEGGVFKFLNKPCRMEDMMEAIQEAYAHHLVIKQERAVLEETLTGSLNLLTDMLSMTHPKAFQRANLVHVWAKQAAPAFDISDEWELLVASKLWPLSYLLLPDELIQKRNKGEPLNESDDVQIAKAYLAVSQMLQNVPRLDKISRILLLSCRGASEAVEAKRRPRSAELLRILINLSFLADVTTGKVSKDAFKRMMSEAKGMDVSLLKALPSVLKAAGKSSSEEIRVVQALYLKVGDVLLTDLHDSQGRLLLASGQDVTESLHSKIHQLNRHTPITAEVKVVRAASRSVSAA